MSKYRERNCEIEAVQITTEWFIYPRTPGKSLHQLPAEQVLNLTVIVDELKGEVRVENAISTKIGNVGDWIIKRYNGAVFLASNEKFSENYEPIL